MGMISFAGDQVGTKGSAFASTGMLPCVTLCCFGLGHGLTAIFRIWEEFFPFFGKQNFYREWRVQTGIGTKTAVTIYFIAGYKWYSIVLPWNQRRVVWKMGEMEVEGAAALAGRCDPIDYWFVFRAAAIEVNCSSASSKSSTISWASTSGSGRVLLSSTLSSLIQNKSRLSLSRLRISPYS
jgi:hypothetical protein